jgi:hypothetical protein
MAAVIVPKNSAANAVPSDASISPNSHPYIKVTVSISFQIGTLLSNLSIQNISENTKNASQKLREITRGNQP